MADYKLVRRRRDASMFWISRGVFWTAPLSAAVHAAHGWWAWAVADIASAILASWVLELGREHRGW